MRVIKSNDTEDKEQAKGAFIDTVINDLEAKKAHPELDGVRHQQKVLKIASEAERLTAFTSKDKRYENSRKASTQSGGRAYTIVKFEFKSRNFTQADAQALESGLQSLGEKHVEVTYAQGKPRAIIHVGLD